MRVKPLRRLPMNNANGYRKALYLRAWHSCGVTSAGCGKTTSMKYRIADIISKEKISVSKLLIVTFTRAAAAEMKEKLRNKL
jgi:hypothetical protein